MIFSRHFSLQVADVGSTFPGPARISLSVPLVFWVRWFLPWGGNRPVHWRMFSSVSGLHPLFISSYTLSPLFWRQKMSPDIAWCLRRKWKWSLWANISFPSWDPDILGQDVPVTDLILIGFMSVFLTCVKRFSFFNLKACRILVLWPETEPTPPGLEAQSLNHWTTREVSLVKLFTPPFTFP